jgi:hypothetical protein
MCMCVLHDVAQRRAQCRSPCAAAQAPRDSAGLARSQHAQRLLRCHTHLVHEGRGELAHVLDGGLVAGVQPGAGHAHATHRTRHTAHRTSHTAHRTQHTTIISDTAVPHVEVCGLRAQHVQVAWPCVWCAQRAPAPTRCPSVVATDIDATHTPTPVLHVVGQLVELPQPPLGQAAPAPAAEVACGVGAARTHARTRTHAHARTRTHARTHTRTHANAHARVRRVHTQVPRERAPRGACMAPNPLACKPCTIVTITRRAPGLW